MKSSKLLSKDSSTDFLSALQACAILEIKPASLYTYVSRGLIQPAPHSGKKSNLYLREDVERLRARSDARMGHGAVAATAMRWGQPVIGTSITEITPQGPRYRGHLATDLVRHPGQFECVAEWRCCTDHAEDEVTPTPERLMPPRLKCGRSSDVQHPACG